MIIINFYLYTPFKQREMDSFYVLVSDSYGGFEFSDAFLEDIQSIGVNISRPSTYLRDDQVVCNYVLEKGSLYSFANLSNARIYKIPLIFKNFYEITEYDGMESITLLSDKLIVSKTIEILSESSHSNVEYLKEFIQLVNTNSNLELVPIPNIEYNL